MTKLELDHIAAELSCWIPFSFGMMMVAHVVEAAAAEYAGGEGCRLCKKDKPENNEL